MTDDLFLKLSLEITVDGITETIKMTLDCNCHEQLCTQVSKFLVMKLYFLTTQLREIILVYSNGFPIESGSTKGFFLVTITYGLLINRINKD